VVPEYRPLGNLPTLRRELYLSVRLHGHQPVLGEPLQCECDGWSGHREPVREGCRDDSMSFCCVAAAAPANSAAIKPGTSAGRMPLNVSVADLASATAGLANDVDAVNQ
jgi:hypothetical protein